MCAMCSLPIEGPYLLINGKYLHPRYVCQFSIDLFCPSSLPFVLLITDFFIFIVVSDNCRHYRCTDCGIEFKGGDCNEFEGDLYCKVVCGLSFLLQLQLLSNS